MNESKLLEKIGRLLVTAEDQDQAYTELIHLLARVVSGEIAASRVTVDLAARTWAIAAQDKSPE